jgi:hypothetical protein
VEITPDTAFAAAQILSVLLVATMFDPWSKRAAGRARSERRWQVGAVISYGAKVLALVVLLFDMQLVLFDSGWDGAAGTALVLGNYFAIVAAALSILLAVLLHMGALGAPADDAAAGAAESADGDSR